MESGMQLEALLVTADGTALRGTGAGAPGISVGELVFQTGMTGYQEALTDPSYAGQMLIFTYPLVGNYGVAMDASQSDRIHVTGTILRDLMTSAGHRDSHGGLDDMLRSQGVPAIAGIDTRFLVRKVRTHGVLPAALAVALPSDLPPVADLLTMAKALDYDAHDYVSECSTSQLEWHSAPHPDGPRIALLDYGAKQGMIDRLQERGAGVLVVPARMSASDVLALQPDGILLSNGPGDPARLDYVVDTVRQIVEHSNVPVFGICLGHQLLALAAGGRTHKMRFGHRGANQPVLEHDTGRLYLTTQNHGYVVDEGSLSSDYKITHSNLNDNTVEGVAHVTRPVWGVQWHPEACPGPTDSHGMFDRFLDLVADASSSAGALANRSREVVGA